MPSRRMIDPAIWQSETIASLTMRQRLLFIGLFSNADDQGRLRGHPALIRSTIFPYDDISLSDIDEDLAAIQVAGSIFIYTEENKLYIQIRGWWNYQSPQWAYPSDLPAPEGWKDRRRYRHGNQVLTYNWPNSSDNEPPKALGKSLPKEPPKAKGGTIESELESESEIESTPTEADAPAKAPPRKKPKTPKQGASQAMFSALAALCKIDWRVCTEEQRGALNSSEKKLREIGATPDDLGEFHRWWYTHDWRGKKNREPPEPHQVREKWGGFTAWREEITPPDPVPENGNGADPLLSWWQLQLALLNPAWQSARPVSKENGKLIVQIEQPGPRAHLSLPQRLEAAVEALDGVEELEVIA